ncbi:hypothetical protein Gorai_014620 [Gossypium raimondii]|uniref:RNase H type-1 domain-containing protein n=1 Tax=Gossypium raimondii TaxID=29730 RepID=A0A7J8P3L5_GOSRA|nr:hypothetical protein [Gossypium raimondii]
MHSKNQRICWACKDKDRGWAMLAWDKVSLPKGMGGLAFKDIRLFNIALLSSKYFPNGHLFHPKKVDKSLYTWSSIATTANALRKGFGWQNVNKECNRCGASTKNLIHAFKDCPTTLAIVTCGGLDGPISSVIFTFPKKWEKSLRGTVKFNFDATVSNTKTGYGIIVRDFEGFIIGGSFGFKKEEMVSDWVKIYTFEEILKLARMLNITKATFEIDCATLTNRIKKHKDDIALMGYSINECFRNMDRLHNFDVKWENHTCNKVADILSKYAIFNESHSIFCMDYPTIIHKLVMDDVVN